MDVTNQAHGHDMKSVLYGSEDSSVVSDVHIGGKKRLVVDSQEIPFATCEQDVNKVFSKNYTKKERNRRVNEKVGSLRLFDPAVYLVNYEESLNYRKDSTLRNFCGSGNILAHDITDKREASSSQGDMKRTT